jgi:F-type H+-transporting ATPase subunit delta
VEKQLADFEALLAESEDLKRLIYSPVFSTDEQSKAITAIAEKAGLDGVFGNFLKVVAANRRLFALPGMIRGFRDIAANHKGLVTAEVTSAFELTAAQQKELKATLKDVAGKDVDIDLTVDPSLLGGLIVKIGSRQIDTSLRTKLSSMKLALKEVG